MGWLVFVFVAAIALATMQGLARARAMRERYWSRGCAGLGWHQAFRDAPPRDIRAFLHHFVDAFALPRERALCFRPEDQVWTIYETDQTAQYSDTLQLETLEWVLLDEYGLRVDLSRRELTLGALFASTRSAPRRGPPVEF